MGSFVKQLTADGRGAVASLLVNADLSVLQQPVPLFTPGGSINLATAGLNRIVFGRWGIQHPEEVVVCRTNSDQFEIHCHGGQVAVQRIINDLHHRGIELFDGTASTASDVKGTKPGRATLDDEITNAFIQAKTLRTAVIIQRQRNGQLKAEFERLLEIDSQQVLATAIESLLAWSDFGLHLTAPWNVVLAGPPNVGKSSLLNRLVGFERSIVFDQPGTTRDVVAVETAFSGWPFQLSDTAGIRRTTDPLEAEGVARAEKQLGEADLVLELIDGSQTTPVTTLDVSPVRNRIVVAHKSDLRTDLPPVPDAIHVSSLTGDGLDELMSRIVGKLVPTEPRTSQPIPVTLRQVDILQQARGQLRENQSSTLVRRTLQNLCNPVDE